MKREKEKEACIDILSLPNKDRIRLCKEIHNMLLQKVQLEHTGKTPAR